MSKQLKISEVKQEKKPVIIGGFKQNVYCIGTRGGIVGVAQTPNVEQKKYYSLEKRMLPNGYVQEVLQKDYPITSKSVTSYADGADYRNDPSQAIANAPKRVNLGDVSEAQRFLQNPQNTMSTLKQVMKDLQTYIDKQTTPAPKVEKDDTQGGK